MKQPKSEPVYICSVCGKDIAGNPLNSFQKSRYGMKNLVGKIKTLVVVNSCGIKQVVVVLSRIVRYEWH